MDEFNPYKAPEAPLAEPGTNQYLPLAERGSRLGAALLDGFFGLLFIAIPALPVYMLSEEAGVVVGIAMGLSWAAWNFVWLARYGQTVGKRVMNIRIVRTDGSAASLARIIFLRGGVTGLFGSIPYVGGIINLTDVLLIFREDRRCLHDMIADTRVVEVRE